MKLHNLNTKKNFKSRNLCLCIGNFDGIHLGHQHVIKKIIKNSQSDNLKSAIMTFVPHPKIYFKKTDGNFNIITNKYKKNFLNSLGVENYIEYKFNKTLSNLDAVDKLDKKSIHFKNFLFNKKKLKKFRYFNILSNKFFKKNKKKNYDLIYIDGNHHADNVLRDARNSFKLLNKRGFIVFDDFLWDYYNEINLNPIGGVKKFLFEHFGNMHLLRTHQFRISKLQSMRL